jgi:hypothetical protein
VFEKIHFCQQHDDGHFGVAFELCVASGERFVCWYACGQTQAQRSVAECDDEQHVVLPTTEFGLSFVVFFFFVHKQLAQMPKSSARKCVALLFNGNRYAVVSLWVVCWFFGYGVCRAKQNASRVVISAVRFAHDAERLRVQRSVWLHGAERTARVELHGAADVHVRTRARRAVHTV